MTEQNAEEVARITGAEIAGAHDGEAELIVEITYQNGKSSSIPLDHYATRSMMESCGASRVEDLLGKSWTHVRDALSHAYNRFQT